MVVVAIVFLIIGLIVGFWLAACIVCLLYYCGEISIDSTGDADKYRFNLSRFPGEKNRKYSLFKNVCEEIDNDIPVFPQ